MLRAFENKKDNPRHIGMLSFAAYPFLGPSDYPSRVIFIYILSLYLQNANTFKF